MSSADDGIVFKNVTTARNAIMANPNLSDAEKANVLRKISGFRDKQGQFRIVPGGSEISSNDRLIDMKANDIVRELGKTGMPADQQRRVLNGVRATAGMGGLPEIARDMLEFVPEHADDYAANERFVSMSQEIEGLKGEARRRKLREFRGRLHKLRRQVADENRELAALRSRIERLDTIKFEITNWMPGNGPYTFTLQRPEGMIYPKLLQAVSDGEALLAANAEYDSAKITEMFGDVWGGAEHFVVEHDWAAAFANATDFEAGAEFNLPADICMFEFRISGKPIVALAFQADNVMCVMLTIRAKAGWIINGTTIHDGRGSIKSWVHDDDKEGAVIKRDHDGDNTIPGTAAEITDVFGKSLLTFIGRQIKAISIALEAEVAKKEIVRLPHLSNQPPREPKNRTGYAYHVISLAHRTRAVPAPRDPDAEPSRRVRLHFRRGHTRHYQTHKVWIKWQLVGDPDLGFVDKHYKL